MNGPLRVYSGAHKVIIDQNPAKFPPRAEPDIVCRVLRPGLAHKSNQLCSRCANRASCPGSRSQFFWLRQNAFRGQEAVYIR